MNNLHTLEEVKNKQIRRLIALGFHKKLGMSEFEYQRRFPDVLPQPPEYRNKFDFFVIVESTSAISLKEQHAALGVEESYDSDVIINLETVPAAPYYIWTHNGRRYETMNIQNAKKNFSDDETSCTLLEAVSFCIHYPEVIKGRGIDAGNSFYKPEYHSSLLFVREYPELAAHHSGDFTSGLSILSKGKKIVL